MSKKNIKNDQDNKKREKELQLLTAKLKLCLTPKRWQHSVGVSQTAARLAELYQSDAQRMAIAGLVHDCAREMSGAELLQSVQELALNVDEVEKQETVLLHAPVGAKMAAINYGIDDPEICQAIRRHTVGGVEMTVMDKILYLADFIEPNRNFAGVEELRRLAAQDLDKAVLAAFDQSIKFIVRKGGLLHPGTILARNAILRSKIDKNAKK